ncbi:MAG: phospho-sugar mutase [Clostridia bacterium]|nr:phospho-sugar mutase [Clostridia bacterium]MBQ1942981.1 phospho-sugar mutase [Clostridia bacterium]MBQ5801713.1 phospho-sugar mutase [Clostridia bacterium]
MDYRIEYENWLSSPLLCSEGVEELTALKDDEQAIEYRFGAELEFGTAGMRGILGYGTNMMNIYTVRRATQGLAEYIRSLGDKARMQGVVISYDTRKNSERFAREAAGVLSANGIQVYLFGDVRPVPMLSFAVRDIGAAAGIMITASHNPKEYNGYKVYGPDGAQMSPEATEKVVSYITAITDYFSVKSDLLKKGNKGWLTPYVKIVDKGVDKRYYKQLAKLTLSKKAVKKLGGKIKLVYTPVHGSGFVPVTTILKKLGIRATLVEEQVAKDSEFSTVQVPNPELQETLSKGIALANKIGADVVFGTDPDCDRLGVAIRDANNEFLQLSGNQVGILLLDYVLRRLKEEDKLPQDGFVVKSFVTTGMAKAIAENYGVTLYETPVGFKFIGEKIKESEESGYGTYLFGFEESCGYLRGAHSRDKDAVVASMLFAELVCYYTYAGVKVYDRLMEIYEKYGYVLDCNKSYAFDGLNAMARMNAVVTEFRTKPVESFGIYKVAAIRDYAAGVRRLASQEVEEMEIPKNNAVYYEIENGSFVCIRPSGTEPKLKVYYSVRAQNKELALKALSAISDSFSSLLAEVQSTIEK